MKEMMKHKMMNRFHKRNSSSSSSVDFKSGEKLDFKFSSLQALQVPTGWDKLSLSLISVETDKTVSKTGKASVYNGNCRWTETLSESIWLNHDDASKELQQCLYKLLISKGSTRSSILGEVTVNLSSYLSSETSLPVALPLKKCDHGTILQVAIQCLNPRANLRWRDTNSLSEDVNSSDYSDLDNTSDVADGSRITRSVGSSMSNSIMDTSHARESGSREASISTVRSHHSFDSIEHSFGEESSRSNLSEAAVDLIGRPESTASQSSTPNTSVNVYGSPRLNHSPFSSLGSGKNILNRRQDSGKISHNIPASPLRSFGSSEFVMEPEATTPEELRAEARTWERNARKLMVDLELSRKVTNDQTKKLENATMELSTLKTEYNDMKHEIKNLKTLLGESEMKERDAENFKVQVQDKNDIQAELEEEIKFQKDLNNTLALQLDKTQESNLELVTVLQELEETIEKQRLEIENMKLHGEHENGHLEDPKTDLQKQVELNNTWKFEVEIQKFQESQKKLESTILYLEKSLEEKNQEMDLKNKTLLDNESEWREKLSLKDKEISKLEEKLSQALTAPVLKETETETESESREIENPDLVEEIQVLKGKILELERDCNELTDENFDLILKLKESSKDFPTVDTSINSLAGELIEEDTKKTKSDEIVAAEYLQIRCDDLERKCIELEIQMQGFKDTACDLESELEKYRAKVGEKENEIDSMNQLLKHQQEEHANSFNQEEQSDSFCAPEDNVQDGEEEVKQSKDSHHVKNEMEDGYEDIENLIKELESKIEDLNEELLSKTSETEGLKSDCLHKEEEIQSQQYRQRELEAQLSDLQMANNQLEESLKLLKTEVNDTKDSDISDIKILENKLLEAESHNQELELHLAELKQELKDSQDNFLKLSKNLENLEEKSISMLHEIASKEKFFDSELDNLHLKFKQQTEKLTELLENTRSIEENLKNTVSELSANLKSCEYENERLEASLQMISGDFQQLKEEKALLLEKASSMQNEYKIALEEKLLHLQGDREGAQDSELKTEIESLKQSNGQLQSEINRLQDEYTKKKQTPEEESTEDVEDDEPSRIKSVEIALAEALEANEMYKIQLKSFMSVGEKSKVENDEINKQKHKRLEAELSELQERYLNMSLKYAEVEAQREELVLKLKAVAPGRSWFS